MSFLYPRSVSIHRSANQDGVGALGYGGVTRSGETAVFSGLAASIQYAPARSKPDADLASDPSGSASKWSIFIRYGVTLGQIMRQDIIVDDLGVRYIVVAPYWNSLGYNLACNILET